MNELQIEIVQLPHAQGLPLPEYATRGAAGLDLRAAVESNIAVAPGETLAVPTGLIMAIPEGFEAQVRPRSGLALKHSIGVMNSPGTIDSDYRGEVKVIISNFGQESFTINRGDRIAQMVVSRYERVSWKPTTDLTDTERGDGGFGHSGK
jgi:dUTP pyrophosphatase